MQQMDGSFREITPEQHAMLKQLRSDGLEVPPTFTVGEEIEIKGRLYKVLSFGDRELRLRSLPHQLQPQRD